jgi:hypothetical protein
MSFKVKFKAGGKELNVLEANYGLKQETDATGRPSSITRGGKLKVKVEATGETDLAEWMMNNFERKDGSITWIKRDNDATLKELQFKEAYMVDYHEDFDHDGPTPATITFTLSAKEITIGSGSFRNEWPM